MSEEKVFEQQLSEDELKNMTGGNAPYSLGCESSSQRYIHTYHFPNCASTVDKDSWCSSSDACYKAAIEYQGMDTCGRAWD